MKKPQFKRDIWIIDYVNSNPDECKKEALNSIHCIEAHMILMEKAPEIGISFNNAKYHDFCISKYELDKCVQQYNSK